MRPHFEGQSSADPRSGAGQWIGANPEARLVPVIRAYLKLAAKATEEYEKDAHLEKANNACRLVDDGAVQDSSYILMRARLALARDYKSSAYEWIARLMRRCEVDRKTEKQANEILSKAGYEKEARELAR